jgi:hypothetical protein
MWNDRATTEDGPPVTKRERMATLVTGAARGTFAAIAEQLGGRRDTRRD